MQLVFKHILHIFIRFEPTSIYLLNNDENTSVINQIKRESENCRFYRSICKKKILFLDGENYTNVCYNIALSTE